ncbi:uncharacterized protein K489DRAFT_384526 [Dissoconium aciculare CBS 342.82]|uniref:Uncharacterized protein n=1 Tax=Dissoconium aciculare CBS 342.82 TaxID=1314786 RepID=A0A6J3LWL4_9PEZI|nr:uncharacterized protein K489DRAFT_384526 [Dissoconium aciculare CBS 342.82]KAF1819032.1 hypothetical protein K489DRAFT_384526 [Dissoconium aciculare CBS 342.82]
MGTQTPPPPPPPALPTLRLQYCPAHCALCTALDLVSLDDSSRPSALLYPHRLTLLSVDRLRCSPTQTPQTPQPPQPPRLTFADHLHSPARRPLRHIGHRPRRNHRRSPRT